MIQKILFCLLMICVMPIQAQTKKGFITTWKTNAPNESIRIPTSTKYKYNYKVDWGDGTKSREKGDAIHQYAQAGTYQITITGKFPAIKFDRNMLGNGYLNIQSIDQWGDIAWKTMFCAFKDCQNLVYRATDVPNLSQVSNMDYMFFNASSFNGNLSQWDVSHITTMQFTFAEATSFNQPIGNWDVGQVVDMTGTFQNAVVFNQDIGRWDTKNVKKMNWMFDKAIVFNQNIGRWDVGQVKSMLSMFDKAHRFNQDLGN